MTPVASKEKNTMELKAPSSLGGAVITALSVFLVGILLGLGLNMADKIWAFF